MKTEDTMEVEESCTLQDTQELKVDNTELQVEKTELKEENVEYKKEHNMKTEYVKCMEAKFNQLDNTKNTTHMGTENRESGNVLQTEMVNRVTIPSATKDKAFAGLESNLDMENSGGFIQKSKSLSLDMPAFGNESHLLDASCSSDLLSSSFELPMDEVELGAENELGAEVELGAENELGAEVELEGEVELGGDVELGGKHGVEIGAEVELGNELGIDLGVEVGGVVDLGVDSNPMESAHLFRPYL